MSTTALTAVLAKLAGLNLAGKAAVGLAVATGAVGAAAGLPAGVEEPTAVVETAAEESEVEEPAVAEPAEVVVEDEAPVEETSAEESAEDTDEGTAGERGPKERPEAAAFGQSVAADARDGGVVGQEIAARAHERNEERAAARGSADDAEGTEDTEGAAKKGQPEVPTDAVPDAAGNGNGKGQGRGGR